MNRNQILTGYDKMRQDISKAKDKYLEAIFIYIKEYFARDKSRWNWEEFYLGLEQLIFKALEEICYQFDLGKPIWLDSTITEFKRHDKARFTQDNFVEAIDFDFLEIHVIEED